MPDPQSASDSGGEQGEDAADHDPIDDASAITATEPDYYAVLGVHPDAAPYEVRHAYHRLALLWHPDRFMSAPPTLRERAERRTRTLNAAYNVLGDSGKRAAYDLRTSTVQRSHANHAATRSGVSSHRQHPPVVSDIYQGDRVAVVSSADGAGIFLGSLIAIIALVLIVAALKQDGPLMGRYAVLGLGFILAGVAFWCATQGNVLTRLANQVLAGTPPVPPRDLSRNDPSPPHGHGHSSSNHHAGHADHADRGTSGRQPAADSPTTSENAHDVSNADDADDAVFEQFVDEAVDGIPAEFQAAMRNVVVRVKRNPSAQDIARLSVREHGLLLGLYEGVDATRQGVAGAPLPEVITIFRRPIEHYCRHNPDRIREQIRRTVLHELAHHFGIDHDAMPDWIR